MLQQVLKHRPSMLIGGFSAHSLPVDCAKMREIADEVGAWFMGDMAHVAGLVAAGLYPNPVPHAHAGTSTTHKTLRGPRGGRILSGEPGEELLKKLQSSVFPGRQGGTPHHVIAAQAQNAARPARRAYSVGRVR